MVEHPQLQRWHLANIEMIQPMPRLNPPQQCKSAIKQPKVTVGGDQRNIVAVRPN
jgi:hypothetical protein